METTHFEELVVAALDALPDEFLNLMENVEVVVQEWPTRAQLRSVGLWGRGSLLGLYEGTPQTVRSASYGLVVPDKITIFQRPIERICATDMEVRQQVEDTLIHEIGHHFGIGEARMRELEAARDRRRVGQS